MMPRHLQRLLELVLQRVQLAVQPAELTAHDVRSLPGVLHGQPAGQSQEILTLFRPLET